MANFNEATRTVGKRRVVERLPYTGSGVEALGAQVTAILKTELDAQRIILDATKNYIHVEKFVKGQVDLDAEQEALNNILRSVPMAEFPQPAKKLSPYEYLFSLFRTITDEDLEVVLVLVGNMLTLDKWLPTSRKSPKVYGVPVKRLKDAPEDLIVVCGAEWSGPELEDIKFSVKGVML